MIPDCMYLVNKHCTTVLINREWTSLQYEREFTQFLVFSYMISELIWDSCHFLFSILHGHRLLPPPPLLLPLNLLPRSIPLLLSSTMSLTVSAPLTRDNYLTWEKHLRPFLNIGQGVYGYVDGTYLSPPKTITNPTSTSNAPATVDNPAYLTWLQQDQLVLSVKG